ncbi:MAG TPA: NAD-dependent epimerase/dehydratase family protein [Gemmataceae bacterium]|nr:NAD-dependent epimerase/dehydratase family protein [Gemmataceae bacterium]
MSRFFVTGGAGFIGGHLVERLLRRPDSSVVVYDNFSSGRPWHLESVNAGRLHVITGDIKDLGRLKEAMAGCEVVFHLASNPDIARAVREPDIDFWEGTYLTQNVLEAMRQNGVPRLLYSSGSGVYGDTGTTPVVETYSPMRPISTYGASKLAGEALICAYCHMFDMHALAFRFANVVGPRQTHGVAYDFVLRLLRDPSGLQILGDGSQSKSYIHVDDVLDAMLFLHDENWQGFDVFNVATEDYVTVREIADLVVRQLGLNQVAYSFTGGDRGWKGDVPVVRFDSRKLRGKGWSNRRTSREALRDSIDSLIADARMGKLEPANRERS